MKYGIRPENCKFIVNENKRKVVCVLEDTEKNLEEFLRCEACVEDLHNPFWYNETTLPNRFVGIATCSPEDEWNEEIGRRLAFARVKRAYYKSYFKHANDYIRRLDNELDRMVEIFNAHSDRVTASLAREHDRIEKALGR